jgi:thioredoxin 1
MKKEIIDFWADGCGNCKMIEPALAQIGQEFPDITITKMNIKDHEDEVVKYGVTSLPTLVFLKGGEEVAKMMGLKPKSLIIKKVQEVF